MSCSAMWCGVVERRRCHLWPWDDGMHHARERRRIVYCLVHGPASIGALEVKRQYATVREVETCEQGLKRSLSRNLNKLNEHTRKNESNGKLITVKSDIGETP